METRSQKEGISKSYLDESSLLRLWLREHLASDFLWEGTKATSEEQKETSDDCCMSYKIFVCFDHPGLSKFKPKKCLLPLANSPAACCVQHSGRNQGNIEWKDKKWFQLMWNLRQRRYALIWPRFLLAPEQKPCLGYILRLFLPLWILGLQPQVYAIVSWRHY